MKAPVHSTAVSQMPAEERPRERLTRLGPEALRDAELLAILFRAGTRTMGAVALAENVMAHFGSLCALAQASLEELQEVKGLGAVKAVEVKAALELGKWLTLFREGERVRIAGAADVAELLMTRFKDLETEHFKCILLNTKNEVTRLIDVVQGGLDAAPAAPRDVFRQAIREGASAVIFCHNHPSGDPEPSADDVTLTKPLRDSGELLGIRVLDHVIFGDGRFVSLKDRGMM